MAWIEFIKVQTRNKPETFFRKVTLLFDEIKAKNPDSLTGLYLNALSSMEYAVLICSEEIPDDKQGSPEGQVISEYLGSVGLINHSLWKQF